MRDEEHIYSEIQSIFDDLFTENVKVRPDLSARDVPEWDSIAQIRLILSIEKKIRVRFELGEVEAARNLGELVQVIQKRSGMA